MAEMHSHATAFDRALGDELRAIRDRIPWTREEAIAKLRDATGTVIGDRTLLTYEHGIRKITAERLHHLGITYGVDAATILTDAIDRTETARELRCPTCGRES